MAKKETRQRPILDKVRRVREESSREFQKDPRRFSTKARALARQYGIKTASMKPAARSLSELLEKRKKEIA